MVDDLDLQPPPPAIPRGDYPRAQCKRCPRRVAFATLVNALGEPVRNGKMVVRIPLDLTPDPQGDLLLVKGGKVRKIGPTELYLGDRFKRHTCTRKRAGR